MHKYTFYFKEKGGFDRFIKALYEKYKSFGHISGIIKLDNLTEIESTSFSKFFGEQYITGSNVKIPINKFIKIMNQSKFEDFDINILVNEYLNVPLITKKEIKSNKKDSEILFLEKINSNSPNPFLNKIIDNNDSTFKIIHQRYNKNPKQFEIELTNIIKLLLNLPKEKCLIPIYASSITKDPHYLDLDTVTSNLFISFLSEINSIPFPQNRIEKIAFLKKFNLEIDNISNYAITYNLLSTRDEINEFSIKKEPLILNVYNILNTDCFKGIDNEVYVFENPSILSEVINKNINKSVIITNGFSNMGVYLLLDKLVESNVKLFYNGDFDPEGLIIADKLKDRYRDKLILLLYNKIHYQNCISKKTISKSRISKLKNIQNIELFEIREEIEKTKYAGYQENNKEMIITVMTKK